MAAKKRKKVVKLKCSKSDTWRQDFDEGFIIVANPDGSRPDEETVNLLLDKAKLTLLNDTIKEAVDMEDEE